jgi:flagellar hook-associated protein 1
MSFSGLRIGQTGLGASQRAMETAAHNLANVNTEGYSRQRVELRSRANQSSIIGRHGTTQVGMGVDLAGITRAREAFADDVYREQRSQSASSKAQADLLARAEAALGTVDDGLPTSVEDFWNAWEGLSRDPSNLTLRDQVLDAGRAVARWFNRSAAALDGVASEATGRATATVNEINRAATAVADLNERIRDVVGRGGSPNDLLDERDRLLDQLGELAGATSTLEDNGEVRVFIGAIPLVDQNRPHLLSVASDGTPQWAEDARPVAATGKLGADTSMASATIPSYRADLDAAAVAFRDLVNSTHGTGFDLDGGAGGALYAGTGAADLDLAAGVTGRSLAASAGGAATDGNHALAMGSLRSFLGASGQTLGGDLRTLAGRIGTAAVRADAQAGVDQATLTSLDDRRLSEHGVSIDEEMTDMLRYQRAYEASARVITVMDSMLDRLINGTGTTR